MQTGDHQTGAVEGASTEGEPRFLFADYRLFPARRLVFRSDREVPLRGREFDLLLVLLENAGTFVGNAALIARVWPTSTVSESNLRVQVASLRRALGDNGSAGRMIVNVTGRGYSFAYPVSYGTDQTSPAESPGLPILESVAPVARTPALPVRLTDLIGRDATLARLCVHVPHRRLMTIVGSGGIGKTSLSIALGEQCAHLFADGVFFIDFLTVDDAAGVATALAKGLSLRIETIELADAAVEWLVDRNVLLLFDNCEHVIEPAAEMVEAILQRAPGVHIICTSRESLRVQDEWVHRLAPLDAPPPSGELTTEEAMAYSAVQLFVERASACRDSFTMSDEDAGHVSDICRKLDGIPLAVELAAARVDKLNVRTLSELLPDRLQILGQGKRTAKPHQQTLRATLDWSYRLLEERERTTFNRLSIFRNAFSLEAAITVGGDPTIDEDDLSDSLFELVGKSLVTVEPTEEGDFYRLLETSKVYGCEKLEAAGEADLVALRHAEFCLELARGSRERVSSDPGMHWIAAYDRWMDDISAALDWAYSTNSGAVNLGIELAALSAPLASRLARLRRYLDHVSVALNRARLLDPPDPALELRVSIELSYLMQHVDGDSAELRALSQRNTELLEHFHDTKERFDALYYSFGLRFSATDWAGALGVAESYLELVEQVGRADQVINGKRMQAQALHYLGRHGEAIAAARNVLACAQPHPPIHEFIITRVDPKVSARVVQARSLWLSGSPGEAIEIIHDCLALADKYGNNTLCQALAMGAAAISIWMGDPAEARQYYSAIMDVAQSCGLDYWGKWGAHIGALISGEVDPVIDADVEQLMRDDFCTYDARLVDGAMIARIDAGNARWCAPEVLRAHAANQRGRGAIDMGEHEALLRRSIAIAQEQGALAWELRAACDLAELALEREERTAVEPLLAPLVARFGRGPDSADVRRAKSLRTRAE